MRQARALNIPAAAIRVARGLTLEAAARRARVSPHYLRHCERHGFPEVLAARLPPIYGCRLDDFLPRREEHAEDSPGCEVP